MSVDSIVARVTKLKNLQAKLHPPRSTDRAAGRAPNNLLDFVPYATPRWQRPAHLGRLAAVFERILQGEQVKCVISTPPRHGKTELELHAMAYLLQHDPSRQLAYVGYSASFAEDKSRKARELCRNVGVPISPLAHSRKNWRTGVEDGGVWATSIDGPVTGQGFSCFPRGTMVETEDGPRPIETLLLGGVRVRSYDHGEGHMVWSDIVASRSTLRPTVVMRYLARAPGAPMREIECTADHRFFVEGRGYVEARWLRRSDRLSDGSDVISVDPANRGFIEVFDIQIAKTHNFYANGILVHNCIIVDDPVKDRATAESPAARQHTYEWFGDTLFTRLEPNGSIVVVQTRWHPDDLAGRLIRDGWEFINLPAINDGSDPERAIGEALWPERWGVEALEGVRDQLGDYGWSSLYQGQPRSRGGSIFQDAHFYDALPSEYRTVIGFDFAYSSKTYSDYSVAVVMHIAGDKYYVADVVRAQVPAPEFADRLKALQLKYRGARAIGYVGGTELGNVDFIRKLGVDIRAIPAKTDKFVRAQPCAATWNAGRVFVPSARPQWLDSFVTEVCGFTGVRDLHDDQVDALVGAFDGAQSATQRIDWDAMPSLGQRRW